MTTKYDENIRQISWFNRQPTLTSAGNPCVKYIPSDDDSQVIKVSPLTLEPLNMDQPKVPIK